MRKIEHVIFTATIVAKSGLRIGGSDDMLQIGGADLTAIKHPVTKQPYIPGSSIKGKMRSELEKRDGRFGGNNGNEPCGCGRDNCLVCLVFGPHRNLKHRLGPTRIIVRDAQPMGVAAIENKTSTMIDRNTGSAARGSLRTEERVAAGAEFGLEIGVQIYDIDKANRREILQFVLDGIKLLGWTGLGSGVGKGSGQIEIRNPDRGILQDPFTGIVDSLLAEPGAMPSA